MSPARMCWCMEYLVWYGLNIRYRLDEQRLCYTRPQLQLSEISLNHPNFGASAVRPHELTPPKVNRGH
jgi:hypothetical protein